MLMECTYLHYTFLFNGMEYSTLSLDTLATFERVILLEYVYVRVCCLALIKIKITLVKKPFQNTNCIWAINLKSLKFLNI